MLASEISKLSKQNHLQCMMGEFFPLFYARFGTIVQNQSCSRSQMTDIIILANHMPWNTRVGVPGMPKFTDENPEMQNLTVC